VIDPLAVKEMALTRRFSLLIRRLLPNPKQFIGPVTRPAALESGRRIAHGARAVTRVCSRVTSGFPTS